MKKCYLIFIINILFIFSLYAESLSYDEFNQKYQNAASLYQKGEYEEALKIFDLLCEDDFSAVYPSVFLSKAIALYSINNYTEAKTYIEKSILMQPYALKPIFYRSVINNALKDYKSAISDIDYCLEKNSEWSDAYHQKGLIYLNMQEYSLALKNFEAAIDNKSELKAEYYSDRGFAKYYLNDLNGAKEDFLYSLKISSNDNVYLCLIDLCYKLEQYNEGINYAQILIEKNSYIEDAIINRAYILLAQDQYDVVKNDLELIEEKCLNLSSYHKLCCVYYILTDKMELAQASIEKAKSLNENDNDIKILIELLKENKTDIRKQLRMLSLH